MKPGDNAYISSGKIDDRLPYWCLLRGFFLPSWGLMIKTRKSYQQASRGRTRIFQSRVRPREPKV